MSLVDLTQEEEQNDDDPRIYSVDKESKIEEVQKEYTGLERCTVSEEKS
jgi:hypothetical protein